MKQWKKWGAAGIAVLAVCGGSTAINVHEKQPAQAAPPPATVIADVFGDSTSWSGVWENDLQGYLAQAGVTVQFNIHANGGWRCSDWLTIDSGQTVSRMRLAEIAEHPDITIINCGTNDAANCVSGSQFDSIYSQMFLEAFYGYGATRILTTWIAYSSAAHSGESWLPGCEATVNDSIYRQVINSVHGTRIIGPGYPLPADFQSLPNWYLDSGGIHPTAAGYQAEALIYYRALRADPMYSSWWTATPTLPNLCGMVGGRPGYTPDYTSCNTLATA